VTAADRWPPGGPATERLVARVLTRGSALVVIVLGLGLGLMVGGGISPLATAPPLDPATLAGDLVALRPAAFLWLGAIGVLGLPVARLVVAIVGFARRGERSIALVGAATIGVIAAGVVLGLVNGR
jgi:uncharacterized membrane protein